MEEGDGFIDLPHSLRDVRIERGVKGYLAEIRPQKWKKTIWLGTYLTAQEAARAHDAGVFYTGNKKKYNFRFRDFPPLPEWMNLSETSMEMKEEIKRFVKMQAEAAERTYNNPKWKRTYYMQVMWMRVFRIFWL
jgi:hypothetical protein